MHGRARPLELCLPSGQIAACGLSFFLVLDCMFVSCTCGCTHTTAPPTPRVNTDPPVTHSDNRWKRTHGGGNEGRDGETPNTLHVQKKKPLFFCIHICLCSAVRASVRVVEKGEGGGVVRPVLEWVCGETCPSARSRGRRSLPGVGVQTKET